MYNFSEKQIKAGISAENEARWQIKPLFSSRHLERTAVRSSFRTDSNTFSEKYCDDMGLGDVFKITTTPEFEAMYEFLQQYCVAEIADKTCKDEAKEKTKSGKPCELCQKELSPKEEWFCRVKRKGEKHRHVCIKCQKA